MRQFFIVGIWQSQRTRNFCHYYSCSFYRMSINRWSPLTSPSEPPSKKLCVPDHKCVPITYWDRFARSSKSLQYVAQFQTKHIVCSLFLYLSTFLPVHFYISETYAFRKSLRFLVLCIKPHSIKFELPTTGTIDCRTCILYFKSYNASRTFLRPLIKPLNISYIIYI